MTERTSPVTEKEASDAPAWYDADAASAWANGYNAALDALRPARSSAGSESAKTCECEFSTEVCATNPCMRKKIHLAGLTPGSKWPNGAPVGGNAPAQSPAQWATVEVERALYVDRGRDTIACDRDLVGPEGGTLLLKLELTASNNAVAATPWPADTPEGREEVARMIYNAFPYDGPLGKKKPDWIPSGNSFMQHKARALADDIIWALRPAPTGTAQGWRDIGSAPKDGTFILAFAPGRIQDTLAWDKSRECWMNGYDDRPEQPTHWMPLPADPSMVSSTNSESGK